METKSATTQSGLKLPNNCYCSPISVYPKNWNKKGADLNIDWYIHYRFYDPTFKNKEGKIIPFRGKIKGFNRYKKFEDRRDACKQELEIIAQNLKEGYNPKTESNPLKEALIYEIDTNLLFVPALRMAIQKSNWESKTKSNTTSVVNFLEIAINQLRYNELAIKDVRFKHLSIMLKHLKATKEVWSNHMHNHYRTSLIMMFDVLLQNFAIETNDAKSLQKVMPVKKERLTLTADERLKVNKHLKENYFPFWRFTQIFFHSGARITEILRVKIKDVDLEDQTYLALVKKGKSIRWVKKIIKDSVLPLWREIVDLGQPEDYVFNEGLIAGGQNKPIRREQISRRWNVHVKQKLGIKADFYSLKHSNTTETVELLSNIEAAKVNSHTSTQMVDSVYDLKNKSRRDDKIKKLDNSF